MHSKLIRPLLKLLASTLAVLALVAGPSLAVDVTLNLTADQRPVTMPDGTIHQMWGFFDSAGDWAPGPRPEGLVAGDTLTINLSNNLTVPVSIVIPGQAATGTPERVPDGQGRMRVRSFTTEAEPAATQTYTWSNLKAGTFLYQSGTQPALQVSMGLYGAVTVDAGPGEAYPGVAYDSEVVVLYSEIDPEQHDPDNIEKGLKGATPLGYKPAYFLINGQPFDPAAPAPINAGEVGQNVLIRMLNAGFKSHNPLLYNGGYMDLVAEDGNPYPYPKEQYAAHLAPGKTMDAIWMPTAETTYPLFDRSHHLTSGGFGEGGMLAQLQVGAGSATDTVSIIRTRYRNQNSRLRVWASSSDSPAAILTVTGYGEMAYCGNANTDCLPNNVTGDYYFLQDLGTANPGSVTVMSSSGGFDMQTVGYTAPPVAVADAYSASEGPDQPHSEPSPGVLSNDTPGGYIQANHGLKAVLVSGPVNASAFALNEDGSFSYTHNGSETLFDTFTYQAQAYNTTNQNNLGSPSAEAVVTLTITPTNDAPVANDDTASTDSDSDVVVNVLANDTDAEGDTLSIASFSQGANGTVACDTANPGGTCTYTPTGTGDYEDSFSYVATDGNDLSGPATVSVTVNSAANLPPEAVNDFATFDISEDTAIIINVVANDSDPDGTIVPATVCLRFANYPANCWNPQLADRTTKNGGTATNNYDGTVTYTPPPGFLGTDLFRYSVEDNNGAVSNRARARINVVQ